MTINLYFGISFAIVSILTISFFLSCLRKDKKWIQKYTVYCINFGICMYIGNVLVTYNGLATNPEYFTDLIDKRIENIVQQESPEQGLKTIQRCSDDKYFYNNIIICKGLHDFKGSEMVLQDAEMILHFRQDVVESLNQWAHTGHDNDA